MSYSANDMNMLLILIRAIYQATFTSGVTWISFNDPAVQGGASFTSKGLMPRKEALSIAWTLN